MLQDFFIKVPRHRKTINKLYVSLRVFFKMSLTHKNPLLLASRRPPPPPPLLGRLLLLISGPSTSSPPSDLPIAPPPRRTAPMHDRRWCSPHCRACLQAVLARLDLAVELESDFHGGTGGQRQVKGDRQTAAVALSRSTARG